MIAKLINANHNKQKIFRFFGINELPHFLTSPIVQGSYAENILQKRLQKNEQLQETKHPEQDNLTLLQDLQCCYRNLVNHFI